MKLECKYFDIAGRAETMRILLHAAKLDWKDVRMANGEWSTVKETTPLGQVPTLTVNGTEFCQSVAIVRYVSLLVGLYPKDEPFKALIVDETLDVMSECLAKYFHTGTDKSTFQATVVTKYFGLVEARIQQFGGDTKDTVCGIPTVADVDLMTWVHFIQSGFFDHIDKDFFKDYPAILACVKATEKRDIVKAYYASLEQK